jgi:hypothetical protein
LILGHARAKYTENKSSTPQNQQLFSIELTSENDSGIQQTQRFRQEQRVCQETHAFRYSGQPLPDRLSGFPLVFPDEAAPDKWTAKITMQSTSKTSAFTGDVCKYEYNRLVSPVRGLLCATEDTRPMRTKILISDSTTQRSQTNFNYTCL